MKNKAKTQPIAAKTILTDPVHFLAFGFGSGLSPKAPGTVGSLATVPLVLLFSQASTEIYLLLTIIVSVVGIWLCGASSRKLGVHDHSGIVWDEFAGMLVTFILLPITWLSLIVGFALFRLFDILKPWPISWLDKQVHGGLGIMLDDILAGAAAAACLHGMWHLGWL